MNKWKDIFKNLEIGFYSSIQDHLEMCSHEEKLITDK